MNLERPHILNKISEAKMKSNVADYDLLYISQTEKGLFVRKDENTTGVWLPKSQIEFEDKEYRRHQAIRVTIPDWIAEREGLA